MFKSEEVTKKLVVATLVSVVVGVVFCGGCSWSKKKEATPSGTSDTTPVEVPPVEVPETKTDEVPVDTAKTKETKKEV
ncbi:hypothetical protein FACS1894198_2920 [Clostridia bacterium]|nr:hypothetical protein FACS1894198_2920 [Clostridia bacterium]